MLVAKEPSELVKNARLQIGLSQRELAGKTRLSRGRVSQIENGRRVPTTEEQVALCRNLPISYPVLSQACGPRSSPEFDQYVPRRIRLAPIRRDRPTRIRYAAARRRYPELMAQLEAELSRRADAGVIGRFLRDACFDSDLEVVATLSLLSAGALPGLASPLFAGYDNLAPIDPETGRIIGHLLFPCLAYEGALLFPQVTLRTREFGRPRVDHLLVKKGKALAVEIDGDGHREGEPNRAGVLQMPVLRFNEAQVVNLELPELLAEGVESLTRSSFVSETEILERLSEKHFSPM